MQTLINACRQIVSVAVEIRTLPGIDFIKADSMYMRLFAVKEMLENHKPQFNNTDRTAQVSPWRSIDDTAGLGDCEPVIARKLFSEWYEYEIIIFDHCCHGVKGFRANVDCNEGWTEYQRIPGYQYSVNDALEAK